jgi:hypothetical protein
VPGDNGQVLSKPFSQCSVDEMRRALQGKRKPGSSKPMPPGAVERGEQYHLAALSLRWEEGRVSVSVLPAGSRWAEAASASQGQGHSTCP